MTLMGKITSPMQMKNPSIVMMKPILQSYLIEAWFAIFVMTIPILLITMTALSGIAKRNGRVHSKIPTSALLDLCYPLFPHTRSPKTLLHPMRLLPRTIEVCHQTTRMSIFSWSLTALMTVVIPLLYLITPPL